MAHDAKPTIWSISPDFNEVSTRLSELAAREDAIIAELAASDAILRDRTRLNPLRSTEDRSSETIMPTVPKRLSAAALALLGRRAPAQPDPTAEPAKPIVKYNDPLHARRLELCADLEATRAAVETLRPQWERLHRDGSKRLAEALKAEHAALAEGVCLAMVQLGNAKLQYDAFLARHASANTGYLKPLSTDFRDLGDPRQRSDGFREFLSDAAEQGHFALSSIPAPWRSTEPHAAAARPAVRIDDAPVEHTPVLKQPSGRLFILDGGGFKRTPAP